MDTARDSEELSPSADADGERAEANPRPNPRAPPSAAQATHPARRVSRPPALHRPHALIATPPARASRRPTPGRARAPPRPAAPWAGGRRGRRVPAPHPAGTLRGGLWPTKSAVEGGGGGGGGGGGRGGGGGTRGVASGARWAVRDAF